MRHISKYKSKKKPTKYEIEDIRKNASMLINSLIEYGQRKDLVEIRKMQVRVDYSHLGKEHHLDLFMTNPAFVLVDNFIKKFEIPPEKLFTKPLIKRFEWASKVDKDFKF